MEQLFITHGWKKNKSMTKIVPIAYIFVSKFIRWVKRNGLKANSPAFIVTSPMQNNGISGAYTGSYNIITVRCSENLLCFDISNISFSLVGKGLLVLGLVLPSRTKFSFVHL